MERTTQNINEILHFLNLKLELQSRRLDKLEAEFSRPNLHINTVNVHVGDVNTLTLHADDSADEFVN